MAGALGYPSGNMVSLGFRNPESDAAALLRDLGQQSYIQSGPPCSQG